MLIHYFSVKVCCLSWVFNVIKRFLKHYLFWNEVLEQKKKCELNKLKKNNIFYKKEFCYLVFDS